MCEITATSDAYKNILEKAIDYYLIVGPKEFSIEKFSIDKDVNKDLIVEYFTNSNELLAVIMKKRMSEKIFLLRELISKEPTIKRKFRCFFKLYLDDSSEFKKTRENYRIFVNMKLDSKYESSLNVSDCIEQLVVLLKEVFEEGIQTKELDNSSLEVAHNVVSTASGMLLLSFSNSKYDLKYELEYYINTIEELIFNKKYHYTV